MAEAVAILVRPSNYDGKTDVWNLISFEETRVHSDRNRLIAQLGAAASTWRNALGRDTMVSIIDADKCRNTNNHDGFAGARPATH